MKQIIKAGNKEISVESVGELTTAQMTELMKKLESGGVPAGGGMVSLSPGCTSITIMQPGTPQVTINEIGFALAGAAIIGCNNVPSSAIGQNESVFINFTASNVTTPIAVSFRITYTRPDGTSSIRYFQTTQINNGTYILYPDWGNPYIAGDYSSLVVAVFEIV